MATFTQALLWSIVAVAGFVLVVTSSNRAVTHATAIARATSIPPFLIGLTLVALGTDLPEIANSITASVRGHGDLNVGDSIGSAVAQITLVLGLLPFIARKIVIAERRVELVGGLVAASLGVVILLLRDGYLSRADGTILILVWLVCTVVAWRMLPSAPGMPEDAATTGRVSYHAATAVLALVFVGAGAVVAIEALIRITTLLGASEYIVSFFVVAIGTSLPELSVAATAARRGEAQLALGDAFGASLTDATLSVGIGPVVAPVSVTASLGIRGALIAVVATGFATLILSTRHQLSRLTGAALLVVYLAAFPVLLLE